MTGEVVFAMIKKISIWAQDVPFGRKTYLGRHFAKTLGWFQKKSNFVRLYNIDVSQDPVRPELSLRWRTSFDRQIYGLKQGDEIQAVVCLAFTNDIPHTVRELDLMSRVSKYEKNADIAIAYTVWCNKKGVGAGKQIMKEVLDYAKTQHLQRVVTLSPLTPMATHFHIRNGAKLISLNSTTQNFEYRIRKN
mgnify:CR=1 FL=1